MKLLDVNIEVGTLAGAITTLDSQHLQMPFYNARQEMVTCHGLPHKLKEMLSLTQHGLVCLAKLPRNLFSKFMQITKSKHCLAA